MQPKEEVFARISLRTSVQKLRSGPPNPGEKQAFWNGHPARTSMKKLRSEKLRADFPFPKESLGWGLDSEVPRLRNVSTEETLGSGVFGHSRWSASKGCSWPAQNIHPNKKVHLNKLFFNSVHTRCILKTCGIPTEQAILRKSKTPRKSPEKVDFSEPRLLQCT